MKARSRFGGTNPSAASRPLRQFLRARHAAVRRQLVDRTGQFAAQSRQQFVARQTGVLRQRIDVIGADRLRQVAFGNVLVRSGADPRFGDLALAVVLKLLEQAAEAAAQHAAGRAAGEQTAQPALEQTAKIAAETAAACRCATGAVATEQAAENVAETAGRRAGVDRIVAGYALRRSAGRRLLLAGAQVLDALVGKQRQDRHGDRRHA